MKSLLLSFIYTTDRKWLEQSAYSLMLENSKCMVPLQRRHTNQIYERERQRLHFNYQY